MKKSLGSFVALNRRMFLLFGVVLCLAGFGIAAWQINAAGASQNDNAQKSGQEPGISGQPAATPVVAKSASQTEGVFRGVILPTKMDISPPLRDIKPLPAYKTAKRPNEERDIIPRVPEIPKELMKPDPVVQSFLGDREIPAPIVSFDGSPTNPAGVAPPDPNGDVGPNHVITMYNLQFQIFNKSGTSVFGPANTNTIFSGFGGACQNENPGDPIVLYDQLADRWLLSQFTAAGPQFFICVAVSTTADPLGTYARYAVPTGGNFPDYPKLGMGPDAYYISTREFLGTGGAFQGVGAYALNRAQVLANNPAAQVLSFLAPASPAFNVGDGLLPADLDGITPPPPGNPHYYMGSMDTNSATGAPQDALTLWKFTVNFAVPASSSFVLANTIPVGAFNSILALCGGARACIPQSGTANRIDHLGYRQRPLFRLAYRNFGTHESLVTNQSVSGGTGPGGEVSGIRWWEIRSPNSGPVVFQEGTFAPGVTDGIHRWMGSIAMDGSGNMGMGYSASSSTMFPSIFYTGRLVNDPLGTMPQGEAAIINGTGSQTGGGNRWGDYTSMSVDPVDDCTFWHVNEYLPATSTSGWRLRVGSFKFPTCGVPTGTLTGTVTNCATSAPISGANVTLTPGGYVGGSIGSGAYTVTAPGGAYTATATKAGWGSGAGATGPVTITNGANTVANYCLTGLPALGPGVAAPTLISESCTPANGVIDPGEQVTVRFPVRNTGAADTVNDIGTLQASGNVTSPGPAQSYGVIVASGADKTADFTFRADPAMVCGTNITATIAHNDSGSLGNVVYTLPTGVNGAPATTSYTGAPVAIPDNNTAGVNVNLPVATAGAVGDLDFRFDTGGTCDTVALNANCAVDHTWVGDLVFTLTSPAGTSVTFVDRIGVPATATGNSGNNFGLSTIDDDGAFPAIESFAGAPVAGSFSPNNPFSAFDGQPATGTWILNVSDRAGADTGSVRRFSLIITPKTCSTNCTTAAGVEVSGRVLSSAGGRGLRGAVVTLRDESGNEINTMTGAMGNFRFAEVEPGHTYIVTIRNRRFQFAPQVLTINDSITDLVFTPE